MSPKACLEFVSSLRRRYRNATRAEKTRILDEVCQMCHYHRKHAIRLLNADPLAPNCSPKPSSPKRRGRPPKYDHPELLPVLKDIWIAANLPCAKRLKAALDVWLPKYPYPLSEHLAKLLRSISPATIDRLMAPIRKTGHPRGRATTRPGSLLKKKIPIKTQQWDESIPGFVEADTVAHCGATTAGMFVYTLNCVDIATGWTEQRAVWGSGERNTLDAIKSIEKALPFPLRGFDCDNGSEFLNWHLYRYLTGVRRVQFTRSRPYRKNDNAHVEGKNWTHVRQLIGYDRFDHPQLVDLLNDIYTSEWRLYHNFFLPSMKLVAKHRRGAKTVKVYDRPKTPLERVLQSEHVPQSTKEQLQAQLNQLDPFELQKRMKNKISALFKVVNQLKQT